MLFGNKLMFCLLSSVTTRFIFCLSFLLILELRFYGFCHPCFYKSRVHLWYAFVAKKPLFSLYYHKNTFLWVWLVQTNRVNIFWPIIIILWRRVQCTSIYISLSHLLKPHLHTNICRIIYRQHKSNTKVEFQNFIINCVLF